MLLRNSIIYFGFSILNQLLYLILIPLIANNLIMEDYGKYSIVSTFQTLIVMFLTLGITSGYQRFYHEEEDKNRFKNTVLSFSIICGLVIGIIIFRLKSIIIKYVFTKVDDSVRLLLFTIIIAWTQSLINIYMFDYSIQNKAFQASIINSVRLIATVMVTGYCLIVLKMGILGTVIAIAIANSLVLVVLIVRDIKNIRFCFHTEVLRKPLTFSIGLIPGAFSNWILTLVDRFFIRDLMNYGAVAIYSMGYKVGMMMDMGFVTPFSSAFTPVKYKAITEEDGTKTINRIYGMYNYIGSIVVLGISLFAKIIILVLSSSQYIKALYIVPIIAFSYYLFGLQMFNNIGLHYANKTIKNSFVLFISALVNIILNILLIPKAGIYGAAIATFGSFLLSNLLYYYYSRKYYDLILDQKKPLYYLFIIAIFYAISLVLSKLIGNMFINSIVNLLLIGIYGYVCIRVRLVKYEEINNILQIIKKKLRK